MDPSQQLEYREDCCTSCGTCVHICPSGVHSLKNNIHHVQWNLCTSCGACVKTCTQKALSLRGRAFCAEEVLAEIQKDQAFYRRSGGGATFSGGEPMLFPAELEELLAGCRRLGIHTAVDTAGNVPYTRFQRVLALTDLFLYDIKVMDEKRHQYATGVSNRLIQENLLRLRQDDARVIVRIPVIPGINDSREELTEMAQFLERVQPERVQLLPYHNYGLGKRKLLGETKFWGETLSPPDDLFMAEALRIFSSRGLCTTIR
jgi:glycyl-radical enzyme activating protein